MSRLQIVLSTIIMLLTASSYAQTKRDITMQWKIAARLPASKGQDKAIGFAGPVAGMHENVMIVGGGANFPDSMPWQGGKKKYYDDVYVYKREGSKIVLLKKTFKLPVSIAYAASCSSLQGIVYAGGENENGVSNKVFLMQWDKTRQAIHISNLPDLPIALTNAAATSSGNIVYVAGGETAYAVSDQFYCLDLSNSTKGWEQLPVLPKPVSHAVLAVNSQGNNQYIYLAGGRRKNVNGISELYSSVFAFDVNKNQWQKKRSLPSVLSAGAGITAGPGSILLFGGDKGVTFHQTEELIAAINTENNQTKKQELIQRKNQLLSSHPGFSKEVLLYDTNKDEWEMIGKIPFDAPVTTIVFKWNGNVIIPGGEIRAGVRTPQILMGKLNFKNK